MGVDAEGILRRADCGGQCSIVGHETCVSRRRQETPGVLGIVLRRAN